MTDSAPPSPRELRDLTAVLARGITEDLTPLSPTELGRIITESIRSANSSSFGPLPDNPTHQDRVRVMAAQVLGELLYTCRLLALGLNPATGEEEHAMSHLHQGLARVTDSPLLRHLAQCPGALDTDGTGGRSAAAR